jgi:hypothetical protein
MITVSSILTKLMGMVTGTPFAMNDTVQYSASSMMACTVSAS